MSTNRPIPQERAVNAFWMRVWEQRFQKNWRVQFRRSASGKGRPSRLYYPKQTTAPLRIDGGFESGLDP